MNSFDFNTRQVEICGKVYNMNFENVDIDKINKKVTKAIENAKSEKKVTQEVVDAFRKLFDTLLNEGAFDEIFKNEPITYYSLAKLTQFLTSEYISERRNMQKDLEEAQGFMKELPKENDETIDAD